MATSPQQYKDALKKILGGSELRVKASNAEEAKLLAKQMTIMQKEITALKKDVSATMKDLRSHFTAEKTEVRAGLISSVFGGKKDQGQDRAKQKEKLRKEQEKVLAPYEAIGRSADDLLLQIDKAKLEIGKWLQTGKPL